MFRPWLAVASLFCLTWNDRPEAASPSVRPGMSVRDVRQLAGNPVSVSRQLLYRRHIEQWVYENPQPLRVQFSCIRGEEPVVTAVLRPRSAVTTGKE